MFTIFSKSFILDVWIGSEYTSVLLLKTFIVQFIYVNSLSRRNPAFLHILQIHILQCSLYSNEELWEIPAF